MASKLRKSVVGLGISEPKLEIRDSREAPDRAAFRGELGRNPKLEDFRLTLEFATFLVLADGCEAGDVYLATIIVLADALG